MADRLSVIASLVGVATTTILSIISLCDAIKRFHNRDRILNNLRHQLQGLAETLTSASQVVDDETPILALLEGPVNRCRTLCHEFELSMKEFHGKSKLSFVDWTKMEFMKGGINDFMGTIEGYKSTIAVGLETVKLRHSKVIHELPQEYIDLLKDTEYNLEVQLMRIEDKMQLSESPNFDASGTYIGLSDEKAITKQCLQICKDADLYIQSITIRETTVPLDETEEIRAHNSRSDFAAQKLPASQTLDKGQTPFSEVTTLFEQRLKSLLLADKPSNDEERLRLQQDIDIFKQCLELCKVATESSQQSVFRVDEAAAEGKSDQVIVTTLKGLFEVKRATSKDRSAQLIAALPSPDFNTVIKHRYNSGLETFTNTSVNSQTSAPISPSASTTQNGRPVGQSGTSKGSMPSGLDTKREKPNSNEVRKRHGDDDNGRW